MSYFPYFYFRIEVTCNFFYRHFNNLSFPFQGGKKTGEENVDSEKRGNRSSRNTGRFYDYARNPWFCTLLGKSAGEKSSWSSFRKIPPRVLFRPRAPFIAAQHAMPVYTKVHCDGDKINLACKTKMERLRENDYARAYRRRRGKKSDKGNVFFTSLNRYLNVENYNGKHSIF